MTKALNTFNDILIRHLRPWILNYSPQKYEQELATIQKENCQFQPLYDLAFLKPLSEKRKYYHTLIENAAITFLNSLHNELESETNNNVKAYWLNKVLDKQLKSKLREVNGLIDRKNYQFANISRANDDAYIIQYLKYQLVRLYLEVQNSYSNQPKDQPLTEEEIVERFFSEPPTGKSFITEAAKISLPNPKPKFSVQPDEPTFIPLKRDIRESKKGVMQYRDIIKDPDRYARFEEQLFRHDHIDQEYNLIIPWGQKQEIGGIFQVLVQKGYFWERNITLKKNITPRAILNFLDHRYNAFLDKQFRYWNNKPKELDDLRGKYFWLDNLPVC